MGKLNFKISRALSGNAYHLLRQIGFLLTSEFLGLSSKSTFKFLSLEMGRKIQKPLKCKHVEHLMGHDTGSILQATNPASVFVPHPFHQQGYVRGEITREEQEE